MSVEKIFEEMLLKAVHGAATGLDEDQMRRGLDGVLFGEAMVETVPEVAEILVESLFEAAPDMLAERAGPEAVTRQQVRGVFGPGLDICEMLLRIASEMGEEFTDVEFGSNDSIPIMPYTLAHLLARTCRIAEETLMLLKHGWGLGAYARWRAMHEVGVFASFIGDHGEETARRFVEHQPVQRWRILRGERARLETAEQDLSDDLLEELADLDRRINDLVEDLGRVFLTDYGWAAQALRISADSTRGPTMHAIEEHAGFGHLRRYYREASASVHPAAAAVLVPDDATLMGSTLLTAPSLGGLVTPAHAMCLTLTNTTAVVLLSRDSWAAPFVIQTMVNLSERAAQELQAAWNGYETQILAEMEREESADDQGSRD